MDPVVVLFRGDEGREINGFVVSASDCLDVLFPPVFVGDEMKTLLIPEIRDGVRGVFAASERERCRGVLGL